MGSPETEISSRSRGFYFQRDRLLMSEKHTKASEFLAITWGNSIQAGLAIASTESQRTIAYSAWHRATSWSQSFQDSSVTTERKKYSYRGLLGVSRRASRLGWAGEMLTQIAIGRAEPRELSK